MRQIKAPIHPADAYPDWISVADFLGLTLQDTHPELSKEWHPTKNGKLTPKDVTTCSNKKAWWKCKKGHEWEARIIWRSRKKRPSGCPYCANKKTNKENCLATTHPEIAKEWHPTKNGNLTPKNVVAGSNKNVWWKCRNNHEWMHMVNYRTQRDYGCPNCSSLLATHPELSKEWHPTKNGKLTPKDVSFGSQKKVWWKCKNNHAWPATVANKTYGYGCPYCSGHKVGSDNCIATTRPEIAKEWHPTKNGELTPKDVSAGSEKKVWWKCKKGHEWEAIISSRSRCGCPHCSDHYSLGKRKYILTDQNNNKHTVNGGLGNFCKKHRLSPGTLFSVLKGTRKNHKGWTIERVN